MGRPALVALLLQNGQGAKNADRRAYLEEGKWVDPFRRPQELLRRFYQQARLAGQALAGGRAQLGARLGPRWGLPEGGKGGSAASGPMVLGASLFLWYLPTSLQRPRQLLTAASPRMPARPQVCWAHVQAGVSNLRLARLRQAAGAMAARFAAAASLEAAADAVEGWSLGRPFCMQSLLAALQGSGGGGSAAVPLPVAKMRLLMGWGLDGRVLRADQLKEGSPELATGWVPSRRAAFRFLRAHQGEVGLEEALALFGGRVKRLSRAYLQEQYSHSFAAQWAPAAPAQGEA